MKINRNLFLVCTVERDDGALLHVHSAPIGSELYKSHFLLLEEVYGHYMSKRSILGLGARNAALYLAQVAAEQGKKDEVERGLLPQIRALTNVAFFDRANQSWADMGYQDALDEGKIDPEEQDEIEGRIIFFTAAWHIIHRQDRERMLRSAMHLWSAQIVLLNYTAYLSSLQTSTRKENSGASEVAV